MENEFGVECPGELWISEDEIPTLNAMALVAGDEDNPYYQIIRAIQKHGTISLYLREI